MGDVADPKHSVWGELILFKDGSFPRALVLDDVVLLGVDEDSVWFQPGFDANGGQRWVARGVPSRVWLSYSWGLTRASDTTYQFFASLNWADGSSEFVPEDGGAALTWFTLDGGVFSWGDAGVSSALRLGHQSSADAGTDTLRVTRFAVHE